MQGKRALTNRNGQWSGMFQAGCRSRGTASELADHLQKSLLVFIGGTRLGDPCTFSQEPQVRMNLYIVILGHSWLTRLMSFHGNEPPVDNLLFSRSPSNREVEVLEASKKKKKKHKYTMLNRKFLKYKSSTSTSISAFNQLTTALTTTYQTHFLYQSIFHPNIPVKMANFMNALGTLSDGLGIISFAKDLLPEASPDEGATIGIKAGRNEKDDPGMVSSILLRLCIIWRC